MLIESEQEGKNDKKKHLHKREKRKKKLDSIGKVTKETLDRKLDVFQMFIQ